MIICYFLLIVELKLANYLKRRIVFIFFIFNSPKYRLKFKYFQNKLLVMMVKKNKENT